MACGDLMSGYGFIFAFGFLDGIAKLGLLELDSRKSKTLDKLERPCWLL